MLSIYGKLINPKKHLISKKETTHIEFHNVNVRHYLSKDLEENLNVIQDP